MARSKAYKKARAKVRRALKREVKAAITGKHLPGKHPVDLLPPAVMADVRNQKLMVDEALKLVLEQTTGRKKTVSNAIKMAEAMVRKAMKGHEPMAKLVCERTGGKPKQQIELQGEFLITLADRISKARQRVTS